MPRPAEERPIRDVRVADADELAVRVDGWELDFLQLEAGAFEGRVRQWTSGAFACARARFTRRLHQRGACASTITIAVPATDAFDIRWRGAPVTPDDVMVFPRSGELDSVSSPTFEVFTVSLAPDAWRTLAPDVAGLAELVDDHEGTVVRCAPDSVRARRRTLEHAASPAGHERVSDETIAVLAVEAIRSARPDLASEGSADDRQRAMRTAIRAIDASLHRPLRIADLCRATGVSERTLQYAFRATFGVSPIAYAHARRLQRVRFALAGAANRRGAVARIAREHGIRHLGRFATAYQERFGERPSETLARTGGAVVRPDHA